VQRSPSTSAELKESETALTTANDLAIRHAFEAAGVEFIDENGGGPGVRLRTGRNKNGHNRPASGATHNSAQGCGYESGIRKKIGSLDGVTLVHAGNETNPFGRAWSRIAEAEGCHVICN
jgi:hypothetical protein